MNATPEHWYNRASIKQLVVHAWREGTIERRKFDRFKIAARGKETYFAWAPVDGEAMDHPLFKLLTKARNLELSLVRATRNIPDNFYDLPEFYEDDGSRRAEATWAIERDEELPSVTEALEDILAQNPGVGEA